MSVKVHLFRRRIQGEGKLRTVISFAQVRISVRARQGASVPITAVAAGTRSLLVNSSRCREGMPSTNTDGQGKMSTGKTYQRPSWKFVTYLPACHLAEPSRSEPAARFSILDPANLQSTGTGAPARAVGERGDSRLHLAAKRGLSAHYR